MVGIAQLVSAPDCGSGGQGFESLYPPYIELDEKSERTFRFSIKVLFLGYRQAVRHRTLTPALRWFEST